MNKIQLSLRYVRCESRVHVPLVPYHEAPPLFPLAILGFEDIVTKEREPMVAIP